MSSLMIDIAANIASLQRDMAKAQTTVEGFGKSVTSAFSTLGKLAGLAGLSTGLMDCATAAMDAEKAMVKMGVALKNQGSYSQAAMKDMQDFAAQIQKTTAYEDDATLAMMANLKSYGMTTEEVKKATKVALDFATAKRDEGMTVSTASDLLGKAYVGATGQLSRYGIVIDKSIEDGKKFEAVMQQLNSRFGGAAQADLATYAGQWQQIKNEFGDIQETIGFGVLKSIQALKVGAGGAGIAFLTMGETILHAFDVITTPIQLSLKALAALAGYAGLTNLSEGFKTVANSLGDARKNIDASKESMLAWTDKQVDALTATDNVTKAINQMNVAGSKTIQVLSDGSKEAQKLAAENAKRIAQALEDEAELAKKFADTNDKLVAETEEAYQLTGAIQDSAFDKEIRRIGEQAGKYEEAGADRIKLHDWVLAQIAKAESDRDKAQITLWQGEEEKWIALMKSEIDEGVKKTDKTIDRLDDEEKKAKDTAEKRSSAMKTMYEGLEGYEGKYYEVMKEMIEKQKKDYETLTGDKVAAEKWATEQLEELDIKKLKSSNKFFDGVEAGYKEAKKNAKDFGDYGYDMFKTFADSSKTAVSSTLFDFFKTGTANLKTIWEGFTDDMLKAFTDAVGDMVSQATTNIIKMTFDAVWNAGASVVIGAIGKLLNYFFSYDIGSIGGNYAYGGPVKGYAYGSDSPANDIIPALLSPGEYVMPRSAVNAQTIPHLEYMRTNKKPRGFAGGGYVDEDSPYADIYKYAGMEYKNGSWNAFSITGWDEILEEWIKTYTPISDPISHAGQYLNNTFGYNLQDEAGGKLGQDDYKYLLEWWGSAIAGLESMAGYMEGFDDRDFDQFRVSPLTGSKNPNVVWVEPEDNGYRWFLRDGSNYWTDPNESNWAKRYMPSIIKRISAIMAAWMGNVAGAYIAAGGSIGVGGVTGGSAISSGMAAGAGGMSASIGAAIGAGTMGGFMSYGENGSVTAALIAALISGAAGYAGASSGIFDWSRGQIISSVIRLGAKSILKTLLSDTFSISPPNVSMTGVEDGGMLASIAETLSKIAPNTSSVEMSLASGLNYVPYDNFHARLHEGEAVLTADENKKRRKGVNFVFNLNGTVIDRQAVNEFAKAIYPKLKKLEAHGY